MNKISPNPLVRVSHGITGATLSRLQWVLKETTGLKYGNMSVDMVDNDTLSFYLTLCGNGNKRISWNRLSHVQTAVEAFFFGLGITAKVTWDTLY